MSFALKRKINIESATLLIPVTFRLQVKNKARIFMWVKRLKILLTCTIAAHYVVQPAD